MLPAASPAARWTDELPHLKARDELKARARDLQVEPSKGEKKEEKKIIGEQ